MIYLIFVGDKTVVNEGKKKKMKNPEQFFFFLKQKKECVFGYRYYLR